MRQALLRGACALALSVAPFAADAAIYEVTLNGKSYGVDGLGYFGGGSLDGYSASISFIFNTRWSDPISYTDPTPPYKSHVGYQYYPEPDEDEVRQYAYLTINGVKLAVSPQGSDYPTHLDYAALTSSPGLNGSGEITARVYDATYYGDSVDITGFYSATASANGFSWAGLPYAGQGDASVLPSMGYASAEFAYIAAEYGVSYATTVGGISNFTSFNIRELADNVSYAPEPATWAMMIIGFGAVGAMLRRDRRAKRRLVAA